MFLQLLEWFKNIVGILNDATKLSATQNRRRIGKQLLELHVLIGRVAKNADVIKCGLQTQHKRVMNGKPLFVHRIAEVLRLQHDALLELERLLLVDRQRSIPGGLQTFLDVYGEDYGREVVQICRQKSNLLRIVAEICNGCFSIEGERFTEFLPRSFDLNDIEAFRDWKESHGHFYTQPEDFLVECKYNETPDIALLEFLNSQIEGMRTVEHLEDSRDAVARIIREHFKFDELF